MISIILKLESLVIFLISVWAYAQFSESVNWFIFVILLLAVDLSMVGYLINPKWGAIIYNLFHNYTTAAVFVIGGVILPNVNLISWGLIISAHVSLDRLLGLGLKYPTNFKDTHLQKI